MVDVGIALPAGHVLVTLADRADLIGPTSVHNGDAWPAFMLEDPVANRLFGRLWGDLPAYQLVLLDAAGGIAAAANCAPLAWDGTDDGLPDGWDDQMVRTFAGVDARLLPNTLGALQIVVAPGRKGDGLSGVMVEAMRAIARRDGLAAVIACVRPTDKHRYPLTPIERYAHWTRPDGLPFDAWMRLHRRLGGRVVKGSPRSMTMRGTVAEWESWTGLAFPDSGAYVVPFATSPVDIDRAADTGVYFDQNVWMVHDLG